MARQAWAALALLRTVGADSRAPGRDTPTYVYPEEVRWVMRARFPDDPVRLYDGQVEEQRAVHCILDYGLLHGCWLFSFERYNDLLGAYKCDVAKRLTDVAAKRLTDVTAKRLTDVTAKRLTDVAATLALCQQTKWPQVMPPWRTNCTRDYGPLYGCWLFSFERYNGLLGAYKCDVAKRLTDVDAKRLTDVAAKRLTDVAVKRLTDVAAKRLTDVAAKRLTDVAAKRLTDVAAKRLTDATLALCQQTKWPQVMPPWRTSWGSIEGQGLTTREDTFKSKDFPQGLVLVDSFRIIESSQEAIVTEAKQSHNTKLKKRLQRVLVADCMSSDESDTEEHYHCWQMFVLACERLCKPAVSRADVDWGDAAFIQEIRRSLQQIQEAISQGAATPNTVTAPAPAPAVNPQEEMLRSKRGRSRRGRGGQTYTRGRQPPSCEDMEVQFYLLEKDLDKTPLPSEKGGYVAAGLGPQTVAIKRSMDHKQSSVKPKMTTFLDPLMDTLNNILNHGVVKGGSGRESRMWTKMDMARPPIGGKYTLQVHRLANFFNSNWPALDPHIHVSHMKLCIRMDHLSYEPPAINAQRTRCLTKGHGLRQHLKHWRQPKPPADSSHLQHQAKVSTEVYVLNDEIKDIFETTIELNIDLSMTHITTRKRFSWLSSSPIILHQVQWQRRLGVADNDNLPTDQRWPQIGEHYSAAIPITPDYIMGSQSEPSNPAYVADGPPKVKISDEDRLSCRCGVNDKDFRAHTGDCDKRGKLTNIYYKKYIIFWSIIQLTPVR
ncbi:hypothetical protein Bbelb_187240 [Branchiostoma belcheri]|nr:hypothetical protein Bbelb_187240 [Branchiostoma belcheri]